MKKELLHSEYRFSKEYEDLGGGIKTAALTVYINYEKDTYDIVQDNQEGILFRYNNNHVRANLAYVELAKEALLFVAQELKFTISTKKVRKTKVNN